MSAVITSHLYKILYPDGIPFLHLGKDEVYDAIKKSTKFGGLQKNVTITEGTMPGGSADFATALANRGATTEVTFSVTRAKEYSLIKIDGEALAASMGDKTVIRDIAEHAADRAGKTFASATVSKMWSSYGGGALGRLNADPGTATSVTLKVASDHIDFHVGHKYVFASDNGTAASPAGLRAGGARTLVTKNENTGVLTFSAAMDAALAADDFIFREGDYSKSLTGIPAWVPPADPSSDLFFGVDRTAGDVQARSGIRATVSGSTKGEKLLNASGIAAHRGADCIDAYCMNPLDASGLLNEIKGNVQYVDKGESKMKSGSLSPREVYIPTGTGWARMLQSRHVPKGGCWGLTLDTWEFCSAGMWGMVDETNGRFDLEGSDDAVGMRLKGYGNLVCHEPAKNMYFAW